MLRSTGVGFFLGLLPGCAPSVTTFVAYDLEKRISKDPDRFGKGAIEGVAAPEGANNATSTAGFRAALLLRAAHGALNGGPAGRIDDVRPAAGPDAL